MDSAAMRFGPGEHGIERSWTRSFNNHGQEFVVRFIVLDEETTHSSTLGMSYVYDADSVTGWKPVRANGEAGTNADPAVVDDFAEPARPFFGADQMAWFVQELKKPADLRLVFNGRALRTPSAPTVNHPKRSCLCGPLYTLVTGGPNFEHEYSYASLTDFPGAKKLFVEALREANAEHVS